MLRLVRSSDLDRLADAAAAVLRDPARGATDPLAPEWIVVGARPLERWLTARLAERLGVCAHVRFLSPSTLVEELIEATLGVPRDAVRAWRPERLTWRVLGALPAALAHAPCAPVREYLRATHAAAQAPDPSAPTAPVGPRALAFARRVAECFARYAASDAPRVRAWDAGAGDDDWQPLLWRALHADGAPDHPTALLERAIAELRAGVRPRGFPERLTWFAHAGAPEAHVRALAALAATGRAVHVLLPAPGTPATDVEPPPLRRSLGRLTDEVARLVDDACAAQGVAPVVVADAGVPDAGPDTALGVLRAELLGAPRGAPVALAADDASFVVHACHGPMRQAEVLRDALLALLDADATLRPRDVLVLAPADALPRLAPLVEAAFGAGDAGTAAGATGGAPALPLRVLGRAVRRTNAAADVALRVLELAAGRVDAVQLLDLVTLPVVAARFGLDEGTEETLRRWVRESGVRWGLDGADRAEAHALPADEEHTWRFGLERLLLGWGLPGDARTLWRGALPLDAVEGSEAERLGRFAEACARTFALVRRARAPQPLGAWLALLRDVDEALVDDGPDALLARRAFRDVRDALAEDARGHDPVLDLGAVRLLLAARCDESGIGEGSAAGVTLAPLTAAHAVPARVVALVGMDDGQWPRARGGVGFDLLVRADVPGAADANAEDRHALLAALLAARERVLVTYTGRTLDTNDEVAPAVPIGELLDALDARAVRADGAHDGAGRPLAARTLVERAHPLQPFGASAFGGDGTAPRSHDATHLAGARALRAALHAPRREPPAFLTRPLPATAAHVARVVSVDALAAFLADPPRTFVRERLGVWLEQVEALDVADPLELDGLGRWTVRDDVLARLLEDRELTAARELQRAAGRLPHGPLGALAFADALAEARRVHHLARERVGATRSDGVTIDRVVDGWRVVGRVGPLFDGRLFEVRAGAVRASALLALWVRHLALHLADAPGAAAPTSVLVGLPGERARDARWTLGAVPDAEARLADLLALYAEGVRTPPLLLPEPSREYAAAFTGKRTPEDAHATGLGKARRLWEERADEYARRLFGDDPIGDGRAFAALARRVWAPLLAAAGVTGGAEGADA